MKKFAMILVLAVITATISFGQNVNFVEMLYDSLDTKSKALFDEYANMHTYGDTIKSKADVITTIVKITGIKHSHEMITDTVNKTVTPKFPEQYMIIYKLNGTPLAFVTPHDPRVKGGNTSCSIAAYFSCSGYTQGDDHYDVSQSKFDGQSAGITEDW